MLAIRYMKLGRISRLFINLYGFVLMLAANIFSGKINQIFSMVVAQSLLSLAVKLHLITFFKKLGKFVRDPLHNTQIFFTPLQYQMIRFLYLNSFQGPFCTM